jgi:hypothetical protein
MVEQWLLWIIQQKWSSKILALEITQHSHLVVPYLHLPVINCVFTRNTAKQTGGAAYFSVTRDDKALLYGNASTAIAVITNTTYFNNSAVQEGGAVYIAVSLNVQHYSSSFVTNLANTGAAAYIEPYASALFKDSYFSNNGNSDTIAGGAIAAFYHLEVVIDTCYFDGNKAVPGSSVHNDLGSITVSNSMLTGNTASGDGTIWTSDTAEVRNCTFVTNLATQGSGVFISTDDAIVSLNSNNFVQNAATSWCSYLSVHCCNPYCSGIIKQQFYRQYCRLLLCSWLWFCSTMARHFW